ncbi:MAG: LPXTG cell wall anchor domain-containing protein [Lachnospiraceae bacterium]|nr:LPXTG cell wall anchor domain-containing protein [Lachnospiraceae bacterium]
MKRIKKVLSFVVALVLFITIIPVDISEEKVQAEVESVDKLSVKSTNMDSNRNIDLANGEESSDTSLTVPVPETVENISSYKATAISNGTYREVTDEASLFEAYNDNNIKFIDLKNDIQITFGSLASTTADIGVRNSSIIMEGNGNTISTEDGYRHAGTIFSFGEGWSQNSYFTIDNINFDLATLNGKVFGSGNRQENLDIGYVDFNINNININSDRAENINYNKFFELRNQKVTISGENDAMCSGKFVVSSAIYVANGTKLNISKPESGGNVFSLMEITAVDESMAGTADAAELIVGDNSSIDMNYNNTGGFGYLILGEYTKIQFGDNCSWTGIHCGGFIGSNSGRNAVSSRKIDFGRNFTQHVESYGVSTLNNLGTAQNTINAFEMNYAEGADFSLIQKRSSDVINTEAVLSLGKYQNITFNSPKSILIKAATTDDTVDTMRYGYFLSGVGSGDGGSLTITNAQANLYSPGSAMDSNLEDNYDGFVSADKIVSKGSTRYTLSGNDTKNYSATANYSGLYAFSKGGKIKYNYMTKYGEAVKTVTYDYHNEKIDVSDNSGTTSVDMDEATKNTHVGTILPGNTEALVSDYMPEHFLWALGNQVPESAATDMQSGGSSTSEEDNGDSIGQINKAIVPHYNSTYEYNIYVYGEEEEVQYQYVDSETESVIQTENTSNSGQEAIGDSITDVDGKDGTANYGNKINFEDSYYTSTNLPNYVTYDTERKTSLTGGILNIDANNDIVKIYVKMMQFDLKASNFSYGITQNSISTTNRELTKEDVMYFGNVFAKNSSGQYINNRYIEIDSTDLNRINDAIAIENVNGNGKLDNYVLKVYNTFNDPTKQSPREITVTLKDTGSSLGNTDVDFQAGNNVIIGANEYTANHENATTISATELLYRAQVKGALDNYDDLSRQDFIVNAEDLSVVNAALANSVDGDYKVHIYNSDKSVPNTIEITVTVRKHANGVLSAYDENNADIITTNGTIGGSDFELLDNGILTVDQAKEFAKVVAKDRFANTYKTSDINIDENQLIAINTENQNGISSILPLTFETPRGERVIVHVTTSGLGNGDNSVVNNPNDGNQVDLTGSSSSNNGNDSVNSGENGNSGSSNNNLFSKTMARVKTGDYNNIILMLVLLLGAGTVLVVIARKKKEDKK